VSELRRRVVPFYGPNSVTIRQVRPISKTAQAAAERGQVGTTIGDMKFQWKTLMGVQETASENHPNWQSGWTTEWFIPTHRDDVGGEFTTTKKYVQLPSFPVAQRIDSDWYRPYVGAGYELRDSQEAAIVPLLPSSMSWPPSGASSETTLAQYGTTAIARCAPRNNVAALATALIELYHDGLPRIIGSATWQARTRGIREGVSSLGDEYLNVQFGLLPLLSDIRDTSRGVLNFNKLYQQYAEGSGKRERRRYDFPSTVTFADTVMATNVSPRKMADIDFSSWQSSTGTGLGDVIRRRETTIHRWFSGAFTYHLPKIDDSLLGHANKAIELLGLDLDPEVLWNVAPWSWAIDWFSSTGDVIHNVNAWSSDGLVLVYGYIMEHSIVRDIYRWTGSSAKLKPEGLVYPEVFILVNETKLRRRATPFGFGLNLSSFSNRQKAIAAALGLSRAF
jgi:hypothetical protein